LGDREHIRQVAALHIEPLHLLVKAELHPAAERHLLALKGKTVNLSEAGSGTHTLSLEVLRFAGLKPPDADMPGDFIASTLKYDDLLKEMDRTKLPDAVFMVMSLPSPIARHLITRHDYRIVSLDFADAFALDAFAAKAAAAGDKGHHVEKSYIYDTVIPAFTYGVDPPVPHEPAHTLGTRLLVVAHKTADARAVQQLIDTMFTSPFAMVSKPSLTPKVLELPPEFALHQGTLDYQERNKPVIAADVVDYSGKLLLIVSTVLGGVLVLGQGLRHWSRSSREQRFKTYLVAVNKIEQEALILERGAELDLRKLLRLQLRLTQLKDEALKKFAAGKLQGEELVAGFLTLVNDTRNYLTRLILHERKTVEDRAAHQGRTLEEVWLESVGPDTPEREGRNPYGEGRGSR
jgi:hypothetical protein